jgi:hypothetical protein
VSDRYNKSMSSEMKVRDPTTETSKRPNLVPIIFYLHFAIVYLSIVSFWCYLFYHEYFTFPEKSDLEMIWKVQGFLFCGTPLAILFAGLVARVKGSWIPYVIVDLIIGLLSYMWIIAISLLVLHGKLP